MCIPFIADATEHVLERISMLGDYERGIHENDAYLQHASMPAQCPGLLG